MISPLALVCLATLIQQPAAQEPADRGQPAAALGTLAPKLVFLSTFDGSVDAQLAAGDARLHTLERQGEQTRVQPGLHDKSVELAPDKGRFGGALRFTAKKRKMTYYPAAKNMGYSGEAWSGAISFWLQLDPATDLEPGFCDPIQITDTRYNDASIWVDFTKENPRSFRLGVMGDLQVWNPDNLGPDDNPAFAERLVVVDPQPFSRERWTHILINFKGLNSKAGRAELYVDGRSAGAMTVTDPFTWDEAQARIMLGLSYIGLMDELAIFSAPLSPAEVAAVHGGPSLAALVAKAPR